MPLLEPIIPPFIAMGRYTQERHDALNKNHQDFLWPQECDLMHNFMCKQHLAFAWDDSERGRFHSNFFPDIKIPIIPHIPFIKHNIPIPPGLYEEVCAIIHKKIASGVYESLNSSYRSCWFCVLKKDGKSLCI